MTISKAWATVFLTAFAALGGCDAGDAGQPNQDKDQGQGRKGQKMTKPTTTTAPEAATKAAAEDKTADKVVKTDAEWRKLLTPEQYRITREKGTEAAFSGEFWNTKKKGIYYCVACGKALFVSDTKFDSGCGWPSFWQPVDKNGVTEQVDRTHGMVRREVMCSRCGAHLGHVFDDGPPPTGLRFCINSGALKFVEDGKTAGPENRKTGGP